MSDPPGTGGPSPLETHPLDFLVIGAQKAGTTSLHRYLAGHPEIFLPAQKELDLFGTPEAFARGIDGVAAHYRDLAGARRIGLSYVGMLFLEGSAERAHAYRPQMKILALLREPVSRAYSAYWYHRRIGWDDAASFEDALEREVSGRLPPGPAGAALAYRRNGCYAEQLEPWLERFGRDRVRVMRTQDLKSDPEATVRGVLRWLGVTDAVDAIDLEARYNVAARARSRMVATFLGSPSSPLKRAYHRLVPRAIRRPLKRQVTRRLERLNARPGRYPPMAEATRARLAAFYAPHNRALVDRLGLDVSAWS